MWNEADKVCMEHAVLRQIQISNKRDLAQRVELILITPFLHDMYMHACEGLRLPG